MNYNQNKKIAQITPYTLIIGVDIAKFKQLVGYNSFFFKGPNISLCVSTIRWRRFFLLC
jgi:hypothetical protein